MSIPLRSPSTRLELRHGLEALAAGLEERCELVVEAARARQRATLPELAPLTEVDVGDVVGQATSVVVELAAVALRSPAAVGAEAPEALERLGRIAARQEVPLQAVLRALRAVHAALLDRVLEHAEAVEAELAVVEAASRHLFGYLDGLVPAVADAYDGERARVAARPESARASRIRAVLDGGARLGLAYPLDGSHTALVLRGRTARAVLRATLEGVDAPTLATEAPDGALWAWIAGPADEAEVSALVQAATGGGCSVGVSGSEERVLGFRATHRKAWLALQLGRRRGAAVTAFGDVALEALAFGGEQMARAFVRAEIEVLLDDAPRVVAVRETLAAYFALGSAAAAGRSLGISERAVVYRLRHAERLLGRPLTVRRAELETALRLHGMFAAASARAV